MGRESGRSQGKEVELEGGKWVGVEDVKVNECMVRILLERAES